MRIPVQNNPGLYRDTETNAILNINSGEREEYLKRRNQRLDEKSRINNLENKINLIEEKLDLILKHINGRE